MIGHLSTHMIYLRISIPDRKIEKIRSKKSEKISITRGDSFKD